MEREAFLNELKAALADLTDEETESIIGYYSEMIDDRMEAGMTEEEAVKAMEPVEVIASRVLSEAGVETRKAEHETERFKEIRKNAAQVTELVVTACNQRVHLCCHEGEDVILRYTIETDDVYQLHEENGQLSLEHTNRPVSSYKFEASKVTVDNLLDEVGKFIKGLNLGNLIQLGGVANNRCIEVVLPRVFKGKINVRTSNSRIEADDVTCLDEVMLTSSDARILVSHMVARRFKAVTSNARVVLEDVYVREELQAGTSNGRICAQKVVSDDVLSLKTSNGSVKLEDVDAKDIIIKTSNATVSGTIKGKMEDYTISGATSNGKNNLPHREGGDRQLTVKTSNGNIAVEFTN